MQYLVIKIIGFIITRKMPFKDPSDEMTDFAFINFQWEFFSSKLIEVHFILISFHGWADFLFLAEVFQLNVELYFLWLFFLRYLCNWVILFKDLLALVKKNLCKKLLFADSHLQKLVFDFFSRLFFEQREIFGIWGRILLKIADSFLFLKSR